MKITKKTRLLNSSLKRIKIDSMSIDDAGTISFTGKNFEGVRGYSEIGGEASFTTKVILGGEPATFAARRSGDGFEVRTDHPFQHGDVVTLMLTPDPANSEYDQTPVSKTMTIE